MSQTVFPSSSKSPYPQSIYLIGSKKQDKHVTNARYIYIYIVIYNESSTEPRVYQTSPSHHFPFNTFTNPSLGAPEFAPVLRAFRMGVGSAGSMGTRWPPVSNGARSSPSPVSFLSRFLGLASPGKYPHNASGLGCSPKFHPTR